METEFEWVRGRAALARVVREYIFEEMTFVLRSAH